MEDLKLSEIRQLVSAYPSRYPLTTRLVEDGVYETALLDQALTLDLFHTYWEVEQYSPLSKEDAMTVTKITEEMLAAEKLREEVQIEEAQLLGHELFKQGGIQAARRAIDYIQTVGRNSPAARALTEGVRYEKQ